jgi:hypothetical protein
MSLMLSFLCFPAPTGAWIVRKLFFNASAGSSLRLVLKTALTRIIAN